MSKIEGKAQKIFTGGAGLTPEERQALKTMIDRFYSVAEKQFVRTTARYQGYAEAYGFDPEKVVWTDVAEQIKEPTVGDLSDDELLKQLGVSN